MIDPTKITKKDFDNLLAFCVLIGNGRGITAKSPTYIKEKFNDCMAGARPLDAGLRDKINYYNAEWLPKEEENVRAIQAQTDEAREKAMEHVEEEKKKPKGKSKISKDGTLHLNLTSPKEEADE